MKKYIMMVATTFLAINSINIISNSSLAFINQNNNKLNKVSNQKDDSLKENKLSNLTTRREAYGYSYKFSDNYYSSSSDFSNVRVLFDFKEKYRSWDGLLQSWNAIGFRARFGVGLRKDFVARSVTNPTHFLSEITTNRNNTLQITSEWFVNAVDYTILMFNLWHDDSKIYFQWEAYFKGNHSSFISIDIGGFNIQDTTGYDPLPKLDRYWVNEFYQNDFYKDDHFSITNVKAYKWKNTYDSISWEEFISKYPVISFGGFVSAGILNDNRKSSYDFKGFAQDITAYKWFSLTWNIPFFKTAGRYTIVSIHIYRVNNLIILEIESFFKGDVTNQVNINLNWVNFQQSEL